MLKHTHQHVRPVWQSSPPAADRSAKSTPSPETIRNLASIVVDYREVTAADYLSWFWHRFVKKGYPCHYQ